MKNSRHCIPEEEEEQRVCVLMGVRAHSAYCSLDLSHIKPALFSTCDGCKTSDKDHPEPPEPAV